MENQMITNKSLSILVVDDEPELRFLLREILSMQGYQVYEASDGVKALVQFKLLQPDIILADIRLPSMDGISLLQAIRRQNQTVGILMISALPQTYQAAKVIELGADGYLQKPFTLEGIEEAIQGLTTEVIQRRNESSDYP